MHKSLLTTLAIGIVLPFSAIAAESYTVDPLHTYPRFKINHLGFSTMQGRFDKTSGKVTLDRAAKTGSVELTIDTASIDTGFGKRNEHLKSPDFFNAAEFPTITYKSTAMRFKGDSPSSVEGNLTISGVTKPVTFTVDAFNCGPDPMDPKKLKYKCGADATAQIKRSDFGVKYAVPAVGDEVKLVLEIEAYRD